VQVSKFLRQTGVDKDGESDSDPQSEVCSSVSDNEGNRTSVTSFCRQQMAEERSWERCGQEKPAIWHTLRGCIAISNSNIAHVL